MKISVYNIHVYKNFVICKTFSHSKCKVSCKVSEFTVACNIMYSVRIL